MSWNDYITNQLTGTGNVTKGAIAGVDGSIWAISEGWGLNQKECLSLATGFTNKDALVQAGMMIAGEKFFFLSGDESVIRGKKGNKGVHVSKTNTAIIIGLYEDPIQPGQCATAVEALADYLKTCNY
ncbi:profilin-like isoform X2 [Palaemon carinicauda]